jgi:dihydrofolate synthase/folylpolyglutamate synthase
MDFRERVKINGQLISTKYIVDFVNRILPIIDQIRPSFFEMTVALAFQYFKVQDVDYAVIETGLGGRLDSTNVVHPLLSVITNIGFDHTDMLGDTLEKIASEKAGIIKKGVPVLIGEEQTEIKSVFERVSDHNKSPIYYTKDYVLIKDTQIKIKGHPDYKSFELDIGGPFIQKNLKTAFAAISILIDRGVGIEWDSVWKFLPDIGKNTYFLGRWHWISKLPPILTDSAHNYEGIAPIISKIHQLGYSKIHFVLGFSANKDLEAMLPLFPSDGIYYFVKARVPRGMDKDILKEKAQGFGLQGKSYFSVRKGLSAAKSKIKEGELIFVGGSIFTIAEVL